MATVRYARWSDRWAAVVTDHILLTILLFVFFGFLGGTEVLIALQYILLVSLGLSTLLGPEGFGLFLLAFAEWLIYFTLFEGINGQTPGKYQARIRVVDPITLKPIGMVRSLERNLLRIVDWLPFIYIVGFIFAKTDERRRRLGDRVANAIVIKDTH